jgi:hypothetical protein
MAGEKQVCWMPFLRHITKKEAAGVGSDNRNGMLKSSSELPSLLTFIGSCLMINTCPFAAIGAKKGGGGEWVQTIVMACLKVHLNYRTIAVDIYWVMYVDKHVSLCYHSRSKTEGKAQKMLNEAGCSIYDFMFILQSELRAPLLLVK